MVVSRKLSTALPPLTLPPLLVGGALFAAGATATLLRDISAFQAAAFLVSLAILTAIASYDVATLRAPNAIVYPGAVATVLAWWTISGGEALGALISGALAFVAVLLVVLAGRGRMGLGDAKVAFLCGAATGARGFVIMFGLAFAIGGLVALGILLLGLKKRSDPIAFTPFLVCGVVAAWFITG